ncbi:MucBP domain-containing protein [Lactococcus lactis]|uniref:MucBP domain-containing protein n=1 Tax=Lactococcus lactis TaxID=1358 RepID=UPI00387799AB
MSNNNLRKRLYKKNKGQNVLKFLNLMCATILLTGSFVPSVAFATESSNNTYSNVQEQSLRIQALSSDESIDSWMPDKNLQAAVSKKLNVATEALSQNDMLKLTSFDAPSVGITSLKGMEYAVNLSGDVDLNYNNISDISPLYSTKITYLRLAGNDLTDVSQFLNMKSVTTLVAPQNRIRDLSSLSGSQITTIIATDQKITLLPQEVVPKQSVSAISQVSRPGGGRVDSFSGVSSYEPSSDTLSWQLDGSNPTQLYADWEDSSWISTNYNALGVGSAGFSGEIIQPLIYKPVIAADVTAKYVDTDGNKISDDVVKSGNVGDAYTTDQKAIDGYTFKEVQGSATGTFTDQAQTVIYVYTKDLIAGGDVTAKYVDTDGNKISDDVVKSGNVGDAYTTDQKAIDGYTFKEVQGSVTGTFTDQAQTVTYVYTKDLIAGGDVTAKYVDTDGNKISDDVVKSGNVGDAYTTDQKAIDGYTFKEVQGSATGTFTDQAQTVIYVYTKDLIAGGDVTAKYVDTDGNKISDDVVKSGNVGDAYTTDQKAIDGYTFKEVQGSATGTFTDQAQTVTYVYTKDLIAGGDVTAKYVDTDGNKISDDVVKSGNVGDAYTTDQKAIDGYTFKEVQGSVTGTFTDQAQTVTYVYTKDLIAGGDVTAKYVDTDGNKISDDVVKSGNVGDAYTTDQKAIDGYTFKEVQGSATGTFTDQAQTVIYIYTKNNVMPSPKPDGHSDTPESSKNKGNKNDSTSENKNILPQTGDNEGLSIIGMISGIFLILATIVMIVLKRKRQD